MVPQRCTAPPLEEGGGGGRGFVQEGSDCRQEGLPVLRHLLGTCGE